MHELVPEPTQKCDLSHLRACRNTDISDGLQFLCIGLCRRLLKRMSYPISDHAEKLIFAETVSDFYALACAGAYSKHDYPVSDHAEKPILDEMVFNFYALACAGSYSKV